MSSAAHDIGALTGRPSHSKETARRSEDVTRYHQYIGGLKYNSLPIRMCSSDAARDRQSGCSQPRSMRRHILRSVLTCRDHSRRADPRECLRQCFDQILKAFEGRSGRITASPIAASVRVVVCFTPVTASSACVLIRMGHGMRSAGIEKSVAVRPDAFAYARRCIADPVLDAQAALSALSRPSLFAAFELCAVRTHAGRARGRQHQQGAIE